MKLKDLIKSMKIAEQIYNDGIKGKYDFNALVKADETGEYIYRAGIDWKKFNYKDGLDALIEIDKIGKYVYDAEMAWKEFDYNEALKALKKIGGKWHDKALKHWPKGIDQSQEKIKELGKTSKKLPMKRLKMK